MNGDSAKMFLDSLLERIVQDPTTGKSFLPGNLSAYEIGAIKYALQVLGGSVPADPVREAITQTPDEVRAPENKDVTTEVTLQLKSLDLSAPEDGQVTLCLDFGTAMSKAFATVVEDGEVVDTLKLKLGRQGGQGGQVYPVPSSLWFTSDGYIFFGDEAIALSLQDSSENRQRFDSLKKELIMGIMDVTMERVPLCREINPTNIAFSKADAITLYLGYLTDMACSELERHEVSRYVRRRFALPPWEEKRRDWGEKMLAAMLAKAQIVADTFHGRWGKGIPIAEAKVALDMIDARRSVPSYLIGEGISEPLAAGTSRLRKEEKARGLAMVIDVGAGTTDFAMFLVTEDPQRDIFKAWPIQGANESLQQAGDYLDSTLLKAILDKTGIVPSHPDYPYVVPALRMTLRSLKEELFRDGTCTVNLMNGDRCFLDLADFLKEPAVEGFATRLSESFFAVLKKADKSFFERFEDEGRITVVLTGGGATLPMVKALAAGNCNLHGMTFYRNMAPLVPEEFASDTEISFVYPQMAVAIGGSLPSIIEEKNAIPTMPGLTGQQWALGRVQVSGA